MPKKIILPSVSEEIIYIYYPKKIIEEMSRGSETKFKILWENEMGQNIVSIENLHSIQNLYQFLKMKREFDKVHYKAFRNYCKNNDLSSNRKKILEYSERRKDVRKKLMKFDKININNLNKDKENIIFLA